jgi:hypothetical protein
MRCQRQFGEDPEWALEIGESRYLTNQSCLLIFELRGGARSFALRHLEQLAILGFVFLGILIG